MGAKINETITTNIISNPFLNQYTEFMYKTAVFRDKTLFDNPFQTKKGGKAY